MAVQMLSVYALGGLRPKGLLGLRKGLLVRFYGEGMVSISKRLYRW